MVICACVDDLPVCLCAAVKMCGVLVGGVVLLCAFVFGLCSFCFCGDGVGVAEGGHWVRPKKLYAEYSQVIYSFSMWHYIVWCFHYIASTNIYIYNI